MTTKGQLSGTKPLKLHPGSIPSLSWLFQGGDLPHVPHGCVSIPCHIPTPGSSLGSGFDVLHPHPTMCILIHPVHPKLRRFKHSLKASPGFSRHAGSSGPGSPGSPAGWPHSCGLGSRPGSGFPCRDGAGHAAGPVGRSRRLSARRDGCAGAGSGAAPGWPPRIPAAGTAGDKARKRCLLPTGLNPGSVHPPAPCRGVTSRGPGCCPTTAGDTWRPPDLTPVSLWLFHSPGSPRAGC